MDIYEIDPLVRSLSLPPTAKRPIFTYVDDAAKRDADIHVIMGDGRLRMREAKEKLYHIIVLDAFSSDAIPVHLLTADAIGEYLEVDEAMVLFGQFVQVGQAAENGIEAERGEGSVRGGKWLAGLVEETARLRIAERDFLGLEHE